MAVVFPNEGELWLMNCLRGATNLNSGNVNVALFKNDFTPDSDTEYADFTVANFSGYATVARSDFTAATTVSGKAVSQCTSVNFVHDGGGTSNTVYGWYMYDSANSKIICAERFASALTFDTSGDIKTVLPVLRLFG